MLQAAAQCGQLQAAWLLVAKGAIIDKPAQYNGRTTLHTACLEGNSAIVQVLIDAGTNVMARDSELDTPLHSALNVHPEKGLSTGHFRAVQWLLICGADMHARNRKGETPLN